MHNTQTLTIAHSSIQLITVYSYLIKHTITTSIYQMSHNIHIHITTIINNHIDIPNITHNNHIHIPDVIIIYLCLLLID